MNIADILNPDPAPEPFKPHSQGSFTSIPRSNIQSSQPISVFPPPHYQPTLHSHFQYPAKYPVAAVIQPNNGTNCDRKSPRSSHRSIILNQPVHEGLTAHTTYTYGAGGQNTTPTAYYSQRIEGSTSQSSFGPRHLNIQDPYTRVEIGASVHGTSSLTTLATLAASRDPPDQATQRDSQSQTKESGAVSCSQSPGSFSPGCLENGKAQHGELPRNDGYLLSTRGGSGRNDISHHPPPSSSCISKDQIAPLQSRPDSPVPGPQETPAALDNTEAHTPTITTASQSDGISSSSLESPTSPALEASGNLAETDPKGDNAERLYTCSYTDHCNTKSPLRKVVSHFFGRNKLATRKIPKHLWVYFCRKHYQRSRYRNPKGFAALQIDLVMSQIENLKKWGGVQDWTVKVRRREEIRQIKFSIHDPDDEDVDAEEVEDGYDDEGLEEAGDQSRRSSSATATSRRRYSGIAGGVPEHYLEYVGDHKSMDEVITLVEKIKNDMETNGGTFPDLELLPNVAENVVGEVGEGDEENDKGKGKKSKAKLKASSGRKRRGTEDIVLTVGASNRLSFSLNEAGQGQEAERLASNHPEPYELHEEACSPRHKRKLSFELAEHNTSALVCTRISIHHGEIVSPVEKALDDNDNHNKRRRIYPLEAHEQQQTITPPPSAPGGSRRTSLNNNHWIESPRQFNDMTLREVDNVGLDKAREASVNDFSRIQKLGSGVDGEWRSYQRQETLPKSTGPYMARCCAEEVSTRLEGTRIGSPRERPSDPVIPLQLPPHCGRQENMLDTITVGRR